jgi:tetratricopeptide (TPR) repeat protein
MEERLSDNQRARPWSPGVEEKLQMAKNAILAEVPDGIVSIFVVGSITRESTPNSDLDMVTVLNDHAFMQSMDRLKPFLRDLSATINKKHPEHELVLWVSKLDHYKTYLPDVSYVRANMPSSADRLDAWCGLAKFTLINYEAVSHICIYGDFQFLDRAAFLMIPKTEAREVLVLSTRTLAQGLAEMYSPAGFARAGANHIAKAGLRAAYAVLIYRSGKALNSYAQIRDSALRDLPKSFHAVLNHLYDTKTSDSASIPPLPEILAFMQYCESQVANAPRLTFDGVVAGMWGESFAFSPDSVLGKESPIEEYERIADAHTNYAHFLYFLTTSTAIVHELSSLDWSKAHPLILDFFFEEISVISVFAFNCPERLRIIIGRTEREAVDIVFDRKAIEQVAELVERTLRLYLKSPKDTAYSRPWLSIGQKLARLKTITDRLQTFTERPIDATLLQLLNDGFSMDEYVDALQWEGRILGGIVSTELIRVQSEIALTLYQIGAVEASCRILEGLARVVNTKDAVAEEFARDRLAPSENMNRILSTACHYYAITLHRLGRASEAQKQYTQALTLNPENFSALADF